MIPYISNHLEVAKGYLLQQYKESINVNSLLEAVITPLQAVENTLTDLLNNRSVITAQGVQLDRLGQLIGESRNYRKDEEYRYYLIARIQINRGGGTPEDIIGAVRYLYNPLAIEYKELYPACFELTLTTDGSLLGGITLLVKSISPVGIGSVIIQKHAENNLILAEDSFELADFRVKESQETSSNLSLDNGDTLEVAADAIVVPSGTLGLAEIVTNRASLALSDGSTYTVDTDNELEVIKTYADFVIQGGSKLSEVINNEAN